MSPKRRTIPSSQKRRKSEHCKCEQAEGCQARNRTSTPSAAPLHPRGRSHPPQPARCPGPRKTTPRRRLRRLSSIPGCSPARPPLGPPASPRSSAPRACRGRESILVVSSAPAPGGTGVRQAVTRWCGGEGDWVSQAAILGGGGVGFVRVLSCV